jgi:glyoxalase/bleomycin resistance protein/dioxygenase superfamily protein
MTQTVRPAEGLFAAPRRIETIADLLANVWQFGYVTTDLDRAIEFMAERFGLEHCLKLPTDTATFLVGDEPAEWEAKFAMGARGGLIVELIEPVAGEVEFYRRFLPSDGSFAVRFHHVATFMSAGDEEWERMRALLAESGLRFDYTVLIPDRVRAGYVDTSAELGHLLEVCQLQPEDLEFFSGLSAESA